MYKLRRSRFAKFISGFLVICLTAVIIANITATYLMMSENLYYATRNQLLQKVYSYVYEYTAGDLMKYLSIAEDMYNNDSSYKNYKSSEYELYRSKYDKANSNIHFEIRDEYNNLLLSNFADTFDSEFIYSSTYMTATPDADYWYLNSDYWYKQGKTDDFSETGYTSLNGDAVTTAKEAIEQAPSLTEEITEIDTPDTPDIDNSELTEDIHGIINAYTGKTVNLHYFHSSEINQTILQYCKSLLSQLPYDITDLTFYQDDFYVSYINEEFDDYEIIPYYSSTDDSIEKKSFETTLITDNKEIEVSYSYNGSFSYSEFVSRLKYLTLITKNLGEERLSFSYVQKGGIQLQVKVKVPYECYISDVYDFAEELTDLAIIYRDHIFIITVFDSLLVLLSLIFIFWSAGYIPKKDLPVARGLHAIPFDLYVFLTVLAVIGCFAMINVNDELFIFLGIIGFVFTLISLIYTIPVRVRAGTLKTNNLTYKFYNFVKTAAAIANEEKNSRLTIALVLCLFTFATLCEIICFVMFGNPEAATFVLLTRVIEAPVMFFLLIGLLALHNGAKAISKGDITYRIKSNFLIGPLKTHARYLNSINDTINNAVDERLKSESLKTELITNVSHDLKTPLTSIVNYIDLLKKEKLDNPKAIEYIEVIDRQSQRLKKLTIDIVEASKAATGNIEVHYEKTTLNVILLQTNGEYIERLEEKSLILVPEIPDREITVLTDGRLLWRVIDNLMNNICKYSMPGTRVYLTLYEDNGNAYISFRNISKEKLNVNPETLTERFVRGDTSRNTEGSGLGLSIANSLTEIMGGTFSISIDGDLFKVVVSFPLTEL